MSKRCLRGAGTDLRSGNAHGASAPRRASAERATAGRLEAYCSRLPTRPSGRRPAPAPARTGLSYQAFAHYTSTRASRHVSIHTSTKYAADAPSAAQPVSTQVKMQSLTFALRDGRPALVAPAAPRAATALKAADEVFDYSSIAGGEERGPAAATTSTP